MIKVWIGCLASYNNGCLHGEWLDLDDYSEYFDLLADIQTKVLSTSKESGAEEWAIFDTEEVPSYLAQGLYPDLFAIWEYHEATKELDDSELEAFAAWFDNLGCGNPPDADSFREAFYGEFSSVTEYAEQFADDTGMLESMPENLQSYFDFEKFGRDMELGGDIYTVDSPNGVLIFGANC